MKTVFTDLPLRLAITTERAVPLGRSMLSHRDGLAVGHPGWGGKVDLAVAAKDHAGSAAIGIGQHDRPADAVVLSRKRPGENELGAIGRKLGSSVTGTACEVAIREGPVLVSDCRPEPSAAMRTIRSPKLKAMLLGAAGGVSALAVPPNPVPRNASATKPVSKYRIRPILPFPLLQATYGREVEVEHDLAAGRFGQVGRENRTTSMFFLTTLSAGPGSLSPRRFQGMQRRAISSLVTRKDSCIIGFTIRRASRWRSLWILWSFLPRGLRFEPAD